MVVEEFRLVARIVGRSTDFDFIYLFQDTSVESLYTCLSISEFCSLIQINIMYLL